MMDFEASDLAGRIAQTWRGGPTTTVWEEELGQMHKGQAFTAYQQLKMQEDHAPSIAKFWAVYRSLLTNREQVDVCQTCDSTGMVIVEYDYELREREVMNEFTRRWEPGKPTGQTERRSYAEACPKCKTGEQRSVMLKTTAQFNLDQKAGR